MSSDAASWKAEFRKLLLGADDEQLKKALVLRNRHVPSTLYRFCSPADEAFSALAHDQIHLASPITFNDPYDSSLAIEERRWVAHMVDARQDSLHTQLSKFGLSPTDLAYAMQHGELPGGVLGRVLAASPETSADELRTLVAVLPAVFAEHVQEFAKTAGSSFQRSLRVCCFSESAASLLLWAHYAKNHEGFCVEFCTHDLPANTAPNGFLFPVLYDGQRFDLGAHYPNVSAKRHEVLAIAAALHKSPDWSYENEWRIVVHEVLAAELGTRVEPKADSRHPEAGYLIAVPTPRAVHAGTRISVAHMARLREICDAKDIRVTTPSLSRYRYEVEVASPDVSARRTA